MTEAILRLLPQTQCTKCGYADCGQYASAIATNGADINQCPTGGATGITRLSQLLDKPVVDLNPQYGIERSRSVAVIDEPICIGCTLCIKACPVDAIIGASKMTHTVLTELCTGCDLCLVACPVDCINMQTVSGDKTGWDAWSQEQADKARLRYELRQARLHRNNEEEQARLNSHTRHAKPSSSKEDILRATMKRATATQSFQKSQKE